jgi:hypothetical protein
MYGHMALWLLPGGWAHLVCQRSAWAATLVMGILLRPRSAWAACLRAGHNPAYT